MISYYVSSKVIKLPLNRSFQKVEAHHRLFRTSWEQRATLESSQWPDSESGRIYLKHFDAQW